MTPAAIVARLYEAGHVTQGEAAILLGVSRVEALRILSDHGVSGWQYTAEEVLSEADVTRACKPLVARGSFRASPWSADDFVWEWARIGEEHMRDEWLRHIDAMAERLEQYQIAPFGPNKEEE